MNRYILKKMKELAIFKDYLFGPLDNSKWLEERVVNIPSSVCL
jgi:hypothetical protein